MDELNECEEWGGLKEIIGTMDKVAKEMGLYLETDPWAIPKAYLEAVIEYIKTFAENIKLRGQIRELKKLHNSWIDYGRDEIFFKMDEILYPELITPKNYANAPTLQLRSLENLNKGPRSIKDAHVIIKIKEYVQIDLIT